MSDFNPYVEWLGLPANVAEPNHYQLLGLADFEADSARIAVAADKAMSRVRSFRPGPNAKVWSKLLDELLLAKGRLLDAERKQEYDAELREMSSTSAPKAEATPPTTSASGDSAGWDPRFPPGMGPNVGKTPPKTMTPEPQPAPAPAAIPTPQPTAAPVAAAPVPVAMPVAAVPNVPPTAWPASMLHPIPHAAPAAPAPGAPLAQPAYAQQQLPYQQPYAQQPAYPGNPYSQQPQYAQPQPYAQPAYGQPYGMPAYPAAQPAAPYGAPQYPAYGQPSAAPPLAEPPVSNPSRFANLGQFQPPSSGQAFGPTAHSPYASGDAAAGMPLDPMAPVAIPTALPGQEEKKSRVVGFAAAQQGASAIPRGKAVSSTAASAPAPAADKPSAAPQALPAPVSDAPSPAAMLPAPTLAASSVESAVAAACSEKEKSDKTLFYVSGGAIVLLLGAIIFAVVNANQSPPDLAENSGENTPVEPNTPAPVEPIKPKPAPVKPPEPVTPKPPVVNPVEPVDPMPPEKMPTETKPPEPMPTERKPVEPKPVEPKPAPPKPPEPKPIEPKPPEPATPVPMPTPAKPPEPPADVKLTPAELAALSQAMNSAKEALRERSFEETDKHLAAAKKLAKSPDQLAKLNRLDVLTQYVKQFDRSLKTLMADENFDAGAELKMGNTRVVVVERSPTMIVIRINGMNRSYSLANMPDGLAMALIDLRLPASDPVSKVIKASYLAAAKVPTEVNQEKAKELFAQAVQEGVSEVADLPLVMTDSYDFKE